jgi:hypothetical protein
MRWTPPKHSLVRAAMAESSVKVGQHGIAAANGRYIRQMALPIARDQPAACAKRRANTI